MDKDTWYKGFRINSHHIKEYDYSQPGAYFITIATYKKFEVFGYIQEDKVILNSRGKIAFESWNDLPAHFSSVEIDEFIVMPDHIHGIIWINYADNRRDTACRVSTIERFGKPVVGSIPTIVRSYKSAVTNTIHINEPDLKIWQSNYYDHIIKNEEDLENIRVYIKYNSFDRFDF
jgi:REP element-mobilizing transposase RayT